MNKFVKVKFNGKISPYLRYVDENYIWTDEQIKSENAKSVEIAKMAFLDHGQPLIPIENLSSVMEQKACYLTPAPGIVFLVSEGGNFITLTPKVEIVEECQSEFYPIEEGFAIVCENDPFDKWGGGLDYIFQAICKNHSVPGFHSLFNFRNRTEKELIDAFKKTPLILFNSSYTEVDWWELMIRCIIKSKTQAKVVGPKPFYGTTTERYDKFVALAAKFGVTVLSS